jgi:hypothetical protein
MRHAAGPAAAARRPRPPGQVRRSQVFLAGPAINQLARSAGRPAAGIEADWFGELIASRAIGTS